MSSDVKREGFDDQVIRFVTTCQRRIDDYYRHLYPKETTPILVVEELHNFVRVSKVVGTNKVPFAYLEKATGDIFKHPSRRSRKGNLFSPSAGMEAVVVVPDGTRKPTRLTLISGKPGGK